MLSTAILIAIFSLLFLGASAAHAQTSACTTYYTSAIATPTGYGASYNLFSNNHEPLITVSCSSGTPTLTAGSNQSNQYIYKLGYVYQSSSWQSVNLTGANLVSTAWYTNQATGSLPTASSNWTYAVGYVCQWSGSAWQCGCHDTTCATGMWQLQAYQSAAESANNTQVPSANEIVDSSGTIWTLTTSGQIARNGTIDPIANGVVLLAYENHVLWQSAKGLWYSWNGTAWIAGSDPRPGTVVTGGGGRQWMLGFNAGNNLPNPDANGNNAIYAAGTCCGFVSGQGITPEIYGAYSCGQSPFCTLNDFDAQTWIPPAHQMISLPMGNDCATACGLEVTSGADDSAYAGIISQIQAAKAAGFAQPVIRLGWEMNGNWDGWGLNNGNTAAQYVAAWQHIVNQFRAAGLTQVKWFWAPALTAGQPDPTPMYPGDAYVDVIGGSLYLNNISTTQTPNAIWPQVLTGSVNANWSGYGVGDGLNWVAQFAAQHNKLIGFGESGSTDADNNGEFIDLMVAWMQSQGSRAALWVWSNAGQGPPGSPDVNFNHFYNDIHPLGPYTGTWNTY
jgi:Glycosyl hydrolase family 26